MAKQKCPVDGSALTFCGDDMWLCQGPTDDCNQYYSREVLDCNHTFENSAEQPEEGKPQATCYNCGLTCDASRVTVTG